MIVCVASPGHSLKKMSMNFPIESQLLSTILTPKTSGNKNNTTKYTYTPKTGREATAIPRNIHIFQKQAKKQKATMVIQTIVIQK